MKTNVIVAAIVAIVVIGGIVIWQSSNNNNELAGSKESMTNEAVVEKTMKGDAKIEGDAMKGEIKQEDAMMKKVGSYSDYSPQAVEAAQKEGSKVVLFFHATWCPFCKTADAAFKANLEKIPAGVTVFKTDYDSNRELKTKYGVTYQHTFVQIDANGNKITAWNSGDIDLLIKNVK